MIVFAGESVPSGTGLNDVWTLSDSNGVFVTTNSVTPNTTPANNPAAAVTITGANFNSGSTVLFTPPGGSQTSIAASMIQAGQLTATIPVGLLTTAGTAQIAVTNASGVPSANLPFTISPLTINSVAPNIASPGTGVTQLTVNGQYFNSSAIVNWTAPGGATVQISPSLIQSAQLAATIPANLFTTPGTAQIAISEPDGTLSNSLPFTIDTPILISPTTLPTGQVSTPYSATLSAIGGIAPYSHWTINSGILPSGLTLDSFMGVIGGTPSATASGVFNLTVTVKDSAGVVSQPQTVSLTIRGSIHITLTGPAKSPTLGHPATFTATVTPSNATGKVTFYDGTTALGVSPLNGGQAVFTTSLLASGARSLKAIYGGNAVLARGVSTALAQTITALPGSGFQPDLTTNIGTGPPGLALADFNGDGKTDLVFPGLAGNVTVMLGKGDGTFLAPVQYSVGSPVYTVVTGDFNGDGFTDIAAGNSSNVSLFLGNGDGTFQAPVAVNTAISARSMIAGDFNGDGKVDLAVANAIGTGMINVLLGNGDGTFQSPVQTYVGGAMSALAVGDFNGDGIADLTGSSVAGSVNILLGKGDGTFQPFQSYAAGTGRVVQIAVQDLNGDGNADLAISSEPGARLITLLGNGDGTFQNAVSYTPGDSLSIASGDFNGDGIPDIVTSNEATTNGPPLVLRVFTGDGDGTFQPAVNYPGPMNNYFALAVGDFNGDGRADIAGVDAASTLHILLGAIPEPAVLCPAVTKPVLTSSTFTLSCAASSGVSPYTWSISTGSLPTGLTLNTATGAIAGTPAAAGSFSFTVQAADSDSPSRIATQNITLKIATPLTLTGSPLPGGTAGSAYSSTLATGGTTPYTCSVSAGALPTGITLTSATCALSGSPSTAATSTFTIAASDSGTPAQMASQAYSLTIANSAPVSTGGGSPPVTPPVSIPVTITNTAIPNGSLGKPYPDYLMVAAGATGVFTWSSDNLPAGLSISTDGHITGTPQAAGVFTGVKITAADIDGFGTGSATFTITITGGLTISGTATLPEVALGGTVSVTFTAANGQTPYTWSSTNLPSGLAINATTGALTGTPAQPGNFSFSIQVTDSNKTAATPFAVTLSVLSITTASSLPNASPSTVYSQSFSAAGGSAPYTFSATGLPAGLSFSSSGVLSGFAKTAGTYTINVTVTDANKFPASSAFTLVVIAPSPLSISKAALTNGTVATPYSVTLAASGGAPPYSWTTTGGTLPDGLTLSASGTISGTPLKAGTFTFTATAIDASAGTASASMSITISPAPLKLTTMLPNAIQGSDYPVQLLSATGGIAPYSFGNGTGFLPPGITLTGGQIGGNPTQSGTFDFTVTVTDSATPPTVIGAPLEIIVKPSQAGLILSSASLSFSLMTGASGLPGASSITVQSSVVTEPLNYSVASSPVTRWLDVTSGTTTPGSLAVSLDPQALSLAASATPYQTSIIVTCVAPSPCAGSAQTIAVSLSVTAPPPQLSITGGLLSLSTTNSAPTSGSFGIQNAGGGTLAITSITAADGWASISRVPASLASGPPQQITVTANPAGLAAGYYLTTVTVVSSAGSADIPVGLLVAQNLTMNLNPAGTQLHMQAGSAPGSTSGSFLLSVTGSSAINWSAAVLPGANWLSVTTASGTASSATPGTVGFAIDPVAAAALSAQAWYGTIRVTSPDIVNSPQDFEVVLNISASSDGISPDPEPAGLVFISNGAAAVPPQTVQVHAGSTAAIPYQASVSTTDGAAWLSVSPGNDNTSAASPAQSTVSVNPATLAPGVYRGGVSYAFSKRSGSDSQCDVDYSAGTWNLVVRENLDIVLGTGLHTGEAGCDPNFPGEQFRSERRTARPAVALLVQ